MKCQQALELLGDLMDDELGRRQRLSLQLHLLICRHCRHYLASYRHTLRAAKAAFRSVDLDDQEIPEEQVAAILEAVRVA